MIGYVKWSRPNDDDWYADILICIRDGSKINIVYMSQDKNSEGQISFDATTKRQVTEGRWVFNISTSESYCAVVEGKLSKFVGEVVFNGTWNDHDDGELWSLHIEADVT